MKITEKIHALKYTFKIPLSPEINVDRFVYSFIIFGNRNIYLIDSGVAASGDSIIKYILKQSGKLEDIKNAIFDSFSPRSYWFGKTVQTAFRL